MHNSGHCAALHRCFVPNSVQQKAMIKEKVEIGADFVMSKRKTCGAKAGSDPLHRIVNKHLNRAFDCGLDHDHNRNRKLGTQSGSGHPK